MLPNLFLCLNLDNPLDPILQAFENNSIYMCTCEQVETLISWKFDFSKFGKICRTIKYCYAPHYYNWRESVY